MVIEKSQLQLEIEALESVMIAKLTENFENVKLDVKNEFLKKIEQFKNGTKDYEEIALEEARERHFDEVQNGN